MHKNIIKRLRIVAFIIGVVLAIGIVVALFTPDATSCTERGCLCSRAGSQGQEVPCNSCSADDYILRTGIFDIVRVCLSREFVTCPASPEMCEDDGSGLCAPVSREVRSSGGCSLDARWFSFAR